MAYRVEYRSRIKWEQRTENKESGRYIWAGIFLLLFLILVNLNWPEGRELLFQRVLPGDAHVTWRCIQGLADSLGQGTSLPCAVQEFCNEMLQSCY